MIVLSLWKMIFCLELGKCLNNFATLRKSSFVFFKEVLPVFKGSYFSAIVMVPGKRPGIKDDRVNRGTCIQSNKYVMFMTEQLRMGASVWV